MADKLVLDTNKIKNVAYQAGQANARITDAEAQLNQIRNHTNWKCREKYMLNSNAEALKSKIHRLQDKSEAFYRAMNNAANTLETAENEISGLFKEVEDLIGNVLSGTTTPPSTVPVLINGAVSRLIDMILPPPGWQPIIGIWNHIQIIPFPNPIPFDPGYVHYEPRIIGSVTEDVFSGGGGGSW